MASSGLGYLKTRNGCEGDLIPSQIHWTQLVGVVAHVSANVDSQGVQQGKRLAMCPALWRDFCGFQERYPRPSRISVEEGGGGGGANVGKVLPTQQERRVSRSSATVVYGYAPRICMITTRFKEAFPAVQGH